MIEVRPGGKGQQQRAAGIGERLDKDRFVVAVRLQQDHCRIAFHQRGEFGHQRDQAGKLAREPRFIVRRIDRYRRGQRGKVHRGRGGD
ncbi:hypothetical protein [Novosphingobium sp. ST904]|uniref:hypothetical protein n=1 Tax=Novosphingobium sp. ST904 TaxID=1684385 RepID=UPI0006C8D24E|nr:hypothetical protein [Novosphingobium sp. ST904]